MSDFTKMNLLSKEKSPYLKEASRQPVNWHPWCEEAFKKAGDENKPVLLDIGASWCHWCHVLDKESYDNKEIAEIINKNFIAIKVDRDERPDLDKLYQEAAQMISGQGGWPLTVFLTHEKIPFYSGTYFPPVERFGMPSFRNVLESVCRYYNENKSEIASITKSIKESLEKKNARNEIPSENIIKESVIKLINSIDTINGGFGSSPKFPNSEALHFLLGIYAEADDKKISKEILDSILDAIMLTLTSMANGGFYDHLRGGFHRYSTDEEWNVPHFEKMLSDNALLLEVYMQAYKLTKNHPKNHLFKKIAEETIEYIKAEMLDEKGFFYSSQDADTNNEEGEYYTWTEKEINQILSGKEAKFISLYYGIADGKSGNSFADVNGRNVLYIRNSVEEISKSLSITIDEINQIIQTSGKKLLAERQNRIKPFTDKTLYTNSNALMINSLITAYKILEKDEYMELALKALTFIMDNLIKGRTLYHTYNDSEARIQGFLDDYQYLIHAILAAYEITFDRKYLDTAAMLSKSAIEKFWDNSSGGFYYAENHAGIIGHDKQYTDASTPAGNSIAVINLIKLSALTEGDNIDYLGKAETTLKNIPSTITEPLYYSTYLTSLNLFINYPIIIKIEKGNDYTEQTAKELFRLTNQRIILDVKPESEEIGKPTIFYACKKGTCSKPLNSINELQAVLLNIYNKRRNFLI